MIKRRIWNPGKRKTTILQNQEEQAAAGTQNKTQERKIKQGTGRNEPELRHGSQFGNERKNMNSEHEERTGTGT